MKKWFRTLKELGEAPHRDILGVMSGTSMDGIDLALCRIHGAGMSVNLEVLESETLDIPSELKETHRKLAFKADTATGDILTLQAKLTRCWCDLISEQLESWRGRGLKPDLLASHGQTVLHLPDRNGGDHSTLQIVDGDRLAVCSGVPVISDFRQKHIATGYEGAPLAPLAEVLLYSDPDETRLFLNLGGIANFTLLRPGEHPEVPLASDTGPANTLIDAAVRRLQPGSEYDEGGRLARSGTVNERLLDTLMSHPFFSAPIPKSTGQETFSWEWLWNHLIQYSDIDIRDLLATLTELTARSVGETIKPQLDGEPCTIYVSGGGWYNAYLMERLSHYLPECTIDSSSRLGLDPDAKEAALFAVLGNETIAGDGWIDASGRSFTLGKISLPR